MRCSDGQCEISEQVYRRAPGTPDFRAGIGRQTRLRCRYSLSEKEDLGSRDHCFDLAGLHTLEPLRVHGSQHIEVGLSGGDRTVGIVR